MTCCAEPPTASLAAIIRKAVTTHESRTLTEVSLTLGELPATIGKSTQICLYRLLQEGLNNAERHAQGSAKSVMADYTDNVLSIEVTDTGSGFDPADITLSGIGLGLPGLRERIESIGGSFEVRSGFGEGTRLIAKFPLIDPELGDGH